MTVWKYLLLCLLPLWGFSQKNEVAHSSSASSMYFPPNTNDNWEKESPSEAGWDVDAIQPLKDYLNQTNTKAFIILVKGKIVMEEYFNGQSAQDVWEWNSAGKTLVASAVGIARQEGLLDISDNVSKYLGERWSREPVGKENLIHICNLLTMTSGLNDKKQLLRRFNLTYVADAGKRWAYSNVFQLLMDVVANAGHQDFDTYFNTKIRDRIGMDGYWRHGIIFTIYHSTARSMARFGLLALNNGKWKDEQIINENFFKESVQTSQEINPSYGYLWWLNGKQSYMLPGGQKVYPGPLVPNAPAGMYAAMGAADQRLYVIPDKNMVIVRMGESSNPRARSFALSGFDKALWEKINAVIK